MSNKIDFTGAAFQPILDFNQMRILIQALTAADPDKINSIGFKILELRTYLESLIGQKTIERCGAGGGQEGNE